MMFSVVEEMIKMMIYIKRKKTTNKIKNKTENNTKKRTRNKVYFKNLH